MLPEKSQTSITKGTWFVHNDGINTIKIHFSSTGKEKIYLNEELVSEQRKINLKGQHNFLDKKDNAYEVGYITTNLMKGEMECLIHRNSELIKSYKTSFRRGKSFTVKGILIMVLSSLAFGFMSNRFELPGYAFYIFLTSVLVVYFVTRDSGEILISEDEETTNA